jgi:hypothetical protein
VRSSGLGHSVVALKHEALRPELTELCQVVARNDREGPKHVFDIVPLGPVDMEEAGIDLRAQ